MTNEGNENKSKSWSSYYVIGTEPSVYNHYLIWSLKACYDILMSSYNTHLKMRKIRLKIILKIFVRFSACYQPLGMLKY